MTLEEKTLWKAAGRRLAAARTRAGYASQKLFAAAVGLSEPTIAKYEQGAREIPMSLLFWLSNQHGINADWVVTGKGEVLQDRSKAPAPTQHFDPKILNRLIEIASVVSAECGQLRPERANALDAAELYNELLDTVKDIRDEKIVEAALKVLRARFKERLVAAGESSGKAAVSSL